MLGGTATCGDRSLDTVTNDPTRPSTTGCATSETLRGSVNSPQTAAQTARQRGSSAKSSEASIRTISSASRRPPPSNRPILRLWIQHSSRGLGSRSTKKKKRIAYRRDSLQANTSVCSAGETPTIPNRSARLTGEPALAAANQGTSRRCPYQRRGFRR